MLRFKLRDLVRKMKLNLRNCFFMNVCNFGSIYGKGEVYGIKW